MLCFFPSPIPQSFLLFFLLLAVDENTLNVRQEQSNFYRWVEAFRAHSHRQAQTDPIQLETKRYTQDVVEANLFYIVHIYRCLPAHTHTHAHTRNSGTIDCNLAHFTFAKPSLEMSHHVPARLFTSSRPPPPFLALNRLLHALDIYFLFFTLFKC